MLGAAATVFATAAGAAGELNVPPTVWVMIGDTGPELCVRPLLAAPDAAVVSEVEGARELLAPAAAAVSDVAMSEPASDVACNCCMMTCAGATSMPTHVRKSA